LVVVLAALGAISVTIISVHGYVTPSFSICLTCHGAGVGAVKLEPKVVTSFEKQCVESREYMRAKHMDLLQAWKESVVRQGQRMYVAADGKEYEMSLIRTCLRCHWNKVDFCDQCHSLVRAKYVRAELDCWGCHTPREGD
jgi:hypothetical protein